MDFSTVEQCGYDTVLTEVRHFHPAQTLDCGQSFRWSEADLSREVPPGSLRFVGIAHGRRLEISLIGDGVVFKDCTLDEFMSVWKDYFDFGRDYTKLHKEFAAYGGEALCGALAFSPGLRLLKQEPWEILISFILSQNSNIPRIKRMIALLCEYFGDSLPCGGFAFPAPETLARLNEDKLAPIRCGYRTPYILDAARRVADGSLDLTALENAPSNELSRALQTIHGVGPKVAECVMLYGFGRTERFPLDVWMKRVMAAHYPMGFPEKLRGFAGIAQQFLFHHIRQTQ